MKKVLIISYYWPPSGGAGVQRWLKFAKYLPDFGWEPILLTVDPNIASYPQLDESLLEDAKGIETHRTKTFELYNIYSKMKKDKQIPYGGFSNEGNPTIFQKFMRFVRGNFFIPDPRKGWNKYALVEAKRLINKYNINTVITTSPPHSTQLIGLQLKKKLGINWIADLRDPWIDIYYYHKFYPTKLARSIDKNYEIEVIQNCDYLITVSPGIRADFIKTYGFESKIKVLTNGFDTSDFPDEIFKGIKLRKEVLFTGTMTADYPMQEVLELAKNNADYPFRFVGNVASEFVDLVKESGLSDQFIFQKSISHDAIIKEMVHAELLLIFIPRIDKNEGLLSGKLFEYLGSRRPIVCIGPENGDVAKVIADTRSGVNLEYNKVGKVAINTILDDLIRDSKSQHINYSRQELTRELSKLIASVEQRYVK